MGRIFLTLVMLGVLGCGDGGGMSEPASGAATAACDLTPGGIDVARSASSGYCPAGTAPQATDVKIGDKADPCGTATVNGCAIDSCTVVDACSVEIRVSCGCAETFTVRWP